MTQNKWVYAGFWRRFVASMIDGMIVILPSIGLNMVLPYIGGVVFGVAYFSLFESSYLMGTPGRLIMGIRLQKIDGSVLSLREAILRWLLRYVSFLFLCLGVLIQPFTLRRQTFHDIVMDTVVVKADLAETEFSYIQIWIDRLKLVFSGQLDWNTRVESNIYRSESSAFNQTSTYSTSSFEGGSSSSVGVGSPVTTPSQTSTVISNSSSAASIEERLEKLQQLFQSGLITEAEYLSKRQEILGQV